MVTAQPLEFYSEPLPGVDTSELLGKLIVIEGPDAVGRSTQIALLRQWLEQEGHAVLDTGMARSALAGKGIKQAKEGNTLGPITMTLFYTTDFADRLENEIIPALRAGFVVLIDRYIFSIMARAVARGEDRRWIEQVAGFALVPHAVYYLQRRRGAPGAAGGDGARGVRLLGKRHGRALRPGHVRKLRQIPGAADPGPGFHGGAVWLHHPRRQPADSENFQRAAAAHPASLHAPLPDAPHRESEGVI